VDDSAEPSTRWYAGSGIYRHVRLITTGYTQFRLEGGIRITTPEITPEQAVVEASYVIDATFLTDEERLAWTKNSWGAKSVKREAVLRSSVLAPDGAVVASTESKITLESMQSGQSAIQRVRVPKPRFWSDTTHELYRLRSTLTLDSRTLDETVTTFGIRQLAFDPDRGLSVNGKPTKLKGVCLHQDAGSFGNAVPTAVWALRLARLREMGCNAIRTSHHPFAPEFYDLCDQMGFYVFDEAFDEWTRDWAYNFTENPRGKAPYGYHLYYPQWHETDLRAMLRRDRNHPSVVLYSIGNEIPNQLDRDGYTMAKELMAICHEEDPARLATSACDQSFVSSRNGFMDVLDIAGYNYIDRLYKTNTYVPERARFPKRLILGTETSTEIHYWLGVRDHDYVIGEFIWTGIDYLGEAGSLPRRGNGSGFLDLAAGKKPGFYQRAAYWRDDPVLNLSVVRGTNSGNLMPRRGGSALSAWNWEAGNQVTVHAAANCDEVELFLNGSSLGRHAVSRDEYATTWSVSYAPGTLSAVGYRAGKEVAAQKLVTAGPAARLQITPLPLPIYNALASQEPGRAELPLSQAVSQRRPTTGQFTVPEQFEMEQVAFFEIAVVDEVGLSVLNATPAVTVRVEGPGRLIGLDTGDLTYGGLFKTDTRNAYQGRLLATVQRTAPTGDVRLTANAPGLAAAAPVTAEFTVQPASAQAK
jgi:beta-galactosidase